MSGRKHTARRIYTQGKLTMHCHGCDWTATLPALVRDQEKQHRAHRREMGEEATEPRPSTTERINSLRNFLQVIAAQAPADDWGVDLVGTVQADFARLVLGILDGKPVPEVRTRPEINAADLLVEKWWDADGLRHLTLTHRPTKHQVTGLLDPAVEGYADTKARLLELLRDLL